MPKKSHSTILIFIGFLISSQTLALELGDVQVLSNLNESLKARIDIKLLDDRYLDELTVHMASNADFKKFGVSKHSLIPKIQVKVLKDPLGKYYIYLYTKKLIKEPLLEFILRVISRNASVVRYFSMFFYPKTHPSANKKSKKKAKAKITTSYINYGKIKVGESLSTIAFTVRQNNNISIQNVMDMIYEHNPHAFINQDINLIKAGALIKVPDFSSPKTTGVKASKSQEIKSKKSQPEDQPKEQSTKQQWLVKNGESLSKIASSLRQNSGTSTQKIIQFLFDENPKAFINNNINRLKSGVLLSIPPAIYNGSRSNEIVKNETVKKQSNKQLDDTKEKKISKPEITSENSPRLILLDSQNINNRNLYPSTLDEIKQAEQDLFLLAVEKIKQLKYEKQVLEKRYKELQENMIKISTHNKVLDEKILFLKAPLSLDSWESIDNKKAEDNRFKVKQELAGTKSSDIVLWLEQSVSIGKVIIILLMLLIIFLALNLKAKRQLKQQNQIETHRKLVNRTRT